MTNNEVAATQQDIECQSINIPVIMVERGQQTSIQSNYNKNQVNSKEHQSSLVSKHQKSVQADLTHSNSIDQLQQQ